MVTKRQEDLLVYLIEEFVKTAEPVSSKFLEKRGFFGLSSATIRAEMNELEGLGLLAQLHTSGGRVPTDGAYRHYVDKHIATAVAEGGDEIKEKDRVKIRMAINGARHEPREISKAIAQTLSDLSDNLVIAGIAEEEDFYKIGLSGLFELPEFREFDRAFRLTSFFDEFEQMFGEMEAAFWGDIASRPRKHGGEVRVFIGRENPMPNVKDETVMFAKYNLPQNYTGSITLVGPTRMDYAKNIGLIKYATRELNKISRAA